MPISLRDLWYAITLSAVLVGVILLCMSFYYFLIEPMQRRRKVGQMLKEGGKDYLRKIQILKAKKDEKTSISNLVLKLILGPERLAGLQRSLLQADIYRDPAYFIGIIGILVAAGFVLGYVIIRNPWAGIFFGSMLGILPVLYIVRKKHLKTLAFESQMPDAMELLARSLRAGHTLPSAIELIGDESSDPMGIEMRITYEEQRFGLSMPEAMINMLERVDSQDLRYFVSALLIQQDTGGNLAELVEKIAFVIRSRLNFKAKVRALTATSRLSAMVMIIVPILAFIGLMIVAPQYERALFETSAGRKMLSGGLILLIIGSLTLKKLIKAVET